MLHLLSSPLFFPLVNSLFTKLSVSEFVGKSWNCCRKIDEFVLPSKYQLACVCTSTYSDFIFTFKKFENQMNRRQSIDNSSWREGEGRRGDGVGKNMWQMRLVTSVCVSVSICHVDWLDMEKDISFRNWMQMLFFCALFVSHHWIVFIVVHSLTLCAEWLVGGHFGIAFLCTFFVSLLCFNCSHSLI